VDLSALVANVIALLSQIFGQAQFKVIAATPDSPITVQGDEDQLTQVIRNLVENAAKYGGEDTVVTIELKNLPSAPGIPASTVSVAIADQGPGIARRHLPRLTERFYRVDDGRSREKGGTGLGLAIVKHIVQRHRGRLLIDSVEGEGSTFTVLLPEAG